MTLSSKRYFKDIFSEAQHSATSHEKLCKQLKRIHEKIPPEEFLNEFINCLKVALVHGDSHPTVENTLNFAAKFSVSLLQPKTISPSDDAEDEEEEMCPFVMNIFKFMFEHHHTENQAIRFRVCQFVNKLLNGLGNEACIDDSLCDQISECMMERLQDKAPAVRVQALMALHRLQDPFDPQCPVMKAFMFHMSSDPSADVRRAVIANIAITPQSVRSILERIHDVKDVVRRTAYISLSKLSVQRFTISQRVRLLTDGLKDGSEMVRNCVSKVMLPAWLQYYKGSFLSLLHALDCENSSETSTLTLKTLFKTEPFTNILDQLTKILNEDKVIPTEELNPESALYWRVLFEHVEAHPEIADDRPVDQPMPEIVPELTTLCNYIRQFYLEKSVDDAEHWVKLQHQYILQQLLEMTKSFDFADEMGRTNLQKLCLDLLTNERVSENVVPVLVQIMVKVIPDVETRLQSLAEVISEVREPLAEEEPEPAPSIPPEEARQRELKQASIRVKINELKEEQDEAIKEQDFKKAQSLKEQWQDLQASLEALAEPVRPKSPKPNTIKDPAKNRVALCKCLRIVREMVQSDSVKSLSATLRSLMENFVAPCVQEDNSPIVRNKALETLGLFSLLDEDLAKEHFVMFAFQIGHDEVCETALKVIFDLLHLYGLETFQVQEDSDGDPLVKKKSKKKKKNLFVTDMYDAEFEDDDESQETITQTSTGSDTNTVNLISMLTSLLDSTSISMRNCAMEGLYKLLLSCRITSSALLSRLILMWYSPVTEGDETLRQPLGVFLNIYSMHCPRSPETLEQAFLPTLRSLMQAPVVSPLSQIDIDSVARLIISLTRPGINRNAGKTTQVHNNMAISICNEILNSDDDSTNVGVLLRVLRHLDISYDDPVFCDGLKTLVKSIIEVFKLSKDKQYLRYIDKFYQNIISGTENTLETAEVENTAVTNQLEGSGAQTSVNNTITSSDLSSRRGSSKNAKLLHPEMSSLLTTHEENDESEDDSDEDNGGRFPSVKSSTIIPASPPRSQSFSDNEEEGQNGAVMKDLSITQDDAVFKVPSQSMAVNRARNKVISGKSKKDAPVHTSVEKKTSSSESDTSSPRAKRKKASAEHEQVPPQVPQHGRVVRLSASSDSPSSQSSETTSDTSPVRFSRHGRRVRGAAAAGFASTFKRKSFSPSTTGNIVGTVEKGGGKEPSSPGQKDVRSSTDTESSPTSVARSVRQRSAGNSSRPQRTVRAQPSSEVTSSPPRERKQTTRSNIKPAKSRATPTSPKAPDSGSPLRSSSQAKSSTKNLSEPQPASESTARNRSPPLRVTAVLNLHTPPSRAGKAKALDVRSSPNVETRRSSRHSSETAGQKRSTRRSSGMAVGSDSATESSPPVRPLKPRREAKPSPPSKSKKDPKTSKQKSSSEEERSFSQSSGVSMKDTNVRVTRQRSDSSEETSLLPPFKRAPQKSTKKDSPSLRVQLGLRSRHSHPTSTRASSQSDVGATSDSDSSPSFIPRRSSRRESGSPKPNTQLSKKSPALGQQVPEQLRRGGRTAGAMGSRITPSSSGSNDTVSSSHSAVKLIRPLRAKLESSPESPQPVQRRNGPRNEPRSKLSRQVSTDTDSSPYSVGRPARLRGKATSSEGESPKALRSTLLSPGSPLFPAPRKGSSKSTSNDSSSPDKPEARRRSGRREAVIIKDSSVILVRCQNKVSENEHSPSRPLKKKLRSSETLTPPQTRRKSLGKI